MSIDEIERIHGRTPCDHQNAIGGKLVTARQHAHAAGVQPGDRRGRSATLPLSTLAEINAAVAAAKKALPAWANTTPMKRARVMFKFKELLEKHADELARDDLARARQGA